MEGLRLGARLRLGPCSSFVVPGVSNKEKNLGIEMQIHLEPEPRSSSGSWCVMGAVCRLRS